MREQVLHLADPVRARPRREVAALRPLRRREPEYQHGALKRLVDTAAASHVGREALALRGRTASATPPTPSRPRTRRADGHRTRRSARPPAPPPAASPQLVPTFVAVHARRRLEGRRRRRVDDMKLSMPATRSAARRRAPRVSISLACSLDPGCVIGVVDLGRIGVAHEARERPVDHVVPQRDSPSPCRTHSDELVRSHQNRSPKPGAAHETCPDVSTISIVSTARAPRERNHPHCTVEPSLELGLRFIRKTVGNDPDGHDVTVHDPEQDRRRLRLGPIRVRVAAQAAPGAYVNRPVAVRPHW